MCIFAELYLGATPWSIYGDVLPNMVKVLGPLPQNWYSRYHQHGRNDSSWYYQRRKPELTLETMIKRFRPEVSSAERAHVLSFMTKGFCYHPQYRITAAQLLCNASFQAVMKIYDA